MASDITIISIVTPIQDEFSRRCEFRFFFWWTKRLITSDFAYMLMPLHNATSQLKLIVCHLESEGKKKLQQNQIGGTDPQVWSNYDYYEPLSIADWWVVRTEESMNGYRWCDAFTSTKGERLVIFVSSDDGKLIYDNIQFNSLSKTRPFENLISKKTSSTTHRTETSKRGSADQGRWRNLQK